MKPPLLTWYDQHLQIEDFDVRKPGSHSRWPFFARQFDVKLSREYESIFSGIQNLDTEDKEIIVVLLAEQKTNIVEPKFIRCSYHLV